MTRSSSPSFAQQVLAAAMRPGVEAAEVFVVRSLNQPVLFESNTLKQIETRDCEGVSLRLWVEGCPGMAVAYGEFDPNQIVETAIALSQLNEPEPIELAEVPPTTQDSLNGELVSVQQLIDWGESALDSLLATPKCRDLQCVLELDCETSTTELYNSKGLVCRYTDRTLSIYGAAEWVRNEDFLCVEAEQTRRDKLDIERFTHSIQERLHWAQPHSDAPVGHVPVLFTGRAAELLWSTVEAALNSKRVIERASPWSDRLGDQVISPMLSLVQNPQIGPFSCPFDDEGTPTRSVEFIHNGHLQIFYTDRTTGRILGCGSTGNGFRPSLERYPTPSLFNLIISPGQYSFQELIGLIPNGLIVDQVLGEVGSISGDFSINVDLGYRVKNGQVMGRVKDTLVSGNVYQALTQVIALGKDVAWHGSCHTPSILVNGLSVTA